MILAELPLDMKSISLTPAANHLFRVNERPTPKDKSTTVSQQSGQVTITI